jgi:NTE family protein
MKSGRSAINEEPILLPEARPEPLLSQVVVLAYLSNPLPSGLISEQLARSLCTETDASVVLVRLEPQNGSTGNGADAQPFLNGEFHLPPELRGAEGGFRSLTLGVRSDPPTPAGIASLVDQLTQHFRYVLIETPVNPHPEAWLFDLLLRSQRAYLFFKPATEDIYHLDLVARQARVRCGTGFDSKPIACLTEGERIDGLDVLTQHVAGPVHLFVHGCPKPDGPGLTASHSDSPDSFRKDVRRIARDISGRLVGLALSSGAAKGFAHVGVIQVLEENGIEIDVVAGASMGAYVAALWAYGCEGRELERIARELEGRWALWSLIDPVFPPRRGFLRGFAVKKRLMRTIGEARFADLVRPLRVVAANLATLERVVFSAGEVATAVHASIAVPGICVPITVGEETYSDGGIVDPLPVDVLREMGVTRVIAVNVIPTPDRIRYGIQAELELARQNGSKRGRLLGKCIPLDRQVNYFARGNLLEILMRSVHGAQIRMAESSCQQADLVLRPDIYDDRWLDYRHPGKFIALGREAAERQLEAIKALVARKEGVHEQQPASEAMAAFI